MGIRALCAAAAVVAGMGSAEAATVANYDFWLRYEGTAFRDLSYASADETTDIDFYGSTGPKEMPDGVKSTLFRGLQIGDVIRAVVQVVHPDVPVEDDPYYGNGGRTPICQIGPWDCTATNYTFPQTDGFFLAFDDVWDLDLKVVVGSAFIVDFWAGAYGNGIETTDDGLYLYTYNRSHDTFTVVDQPAPVPLPATAALLPMGIGALAMMRKRRKSG